MNKADKFDRHELDLSLIASYSGCVKTAIELKSLTLQVTKFVELQERAVRHIGA